MAEPQKDLVIEARAWVTEGCPCGTCKILRQLCDEVEALRKHVADLNHDLEATIKHSDEVYRRMMNDNA